MLISSSPLREIKLSQIHEEAFLTTVNSKAKPDITRLINNVVPVF
jgi:hypothetical protein